jgi:hypothetical protein
LFRQSLCHENRKDKDIAKANLDSIETYFLNKNDDSISMEAAGCKFEKRKLLITELFFNSLSKPR